MLDPKALSQLKQLKKEIHESKERLRGTIRGTSGRFGFVVCEQDKGKTRDVFVSPEEMQKVLPGDEVEIAVVKGKDGKESADIEKLLNSDLKRFVGRYRIRGNNHFIEPDMPRFNRWMFVPPSSRAPKAKHGAEDGDYVVAEIARHPFPSTKALTNVVVRIGKDSDPGIESLYTAAKLDIPTQFPDAVSAAVDSIDSGINDSYTDLLEVPFVTIDSEKTRDMDDALFASKEEQGWTLWAAIADPDAYCSEGDAIDQSARERGTSVYMPGNTLPMLPPELATGRCSLLENEERPALVCKLSVDPGGIVSEPEFQLARIRSQAKLSYATVAALLDGEENAAEALQNSQITDSLRHLHELTQALHGWRQQNALVMEEKPDYLLELDDNKKVKNIHRCDRNSAQKLVEECMLAVNRSAAIFLSTHNTGLFNCHCGFKTEQMGEVKKLLKNHAPESGQQTLDSLDGYVAAIQGLATAESELPLRSILVRRLQSSQLMAANLGHFGLGFPGYATVTSPIRRYSDLFNHRRIKQILRGESPAKADQALADSVQESYFRARQAGNQTEAWLKMQWLAEQEKGVLYEATIQQISSGGIGVLLDATGIQVFVDLRKSKSKYSFDPLTLTAKLGESSLVLDQALKVRIAEVNLEERQVHAHMA